MRTILSFVLLSVLLSSCSLDYRIDRKEDRLIGRWAFDRAFFKDNGALFRDNIYNEYAGDIIEFYPNFEASYDDASERFTYWGEWEVFAQRGGGRDDDTEFFLDMYFYDDRGFESFSYIGEVRRLSRNVLRIEAYDRFGEYTFRLERIY